MKGISGIVATAILLALTVAGGVLLYSYVTRYLSSTMDSGKLVVENAYYIKALDRLTLEVRNVGSREVRITKVEVVTNGSSNSISANVTEFVPPGGVVSITLNGVNGLKNSTPLFVIVECEGGIVTEPVPIRVL